MAGLSDNAQAVLALVSTLLIVAGAISIPVDGAPWYIGLAVALAGAIGLAIKEYLGTQQSKPPPPTPVVIVPEPAPVPPA